MAKQLKIVFGIIVPLLTVFALIYAFQAYLDNRVKNIINDEDFIRKVASNVRPYVIFDEKGSDLEELCNIPQPLWFTYLPRLPWERYHTSLRSSLLLALYRCVLHCPLRFYARYSSGLFFEHRFRC